MSDNDDDLFPDPIKLTYWVLVFAVLPYVVTNWLLKHLLPSIEPFIRYLVSFAALIVAYGFLFGEQVFEQVWSNADDTPDNVIPFPGTSSEIDDADDPVDDEIDCQEWLDDLNYLYGTIVTFKEAGGDTALTELQHNQSVSLFCRACPALCHLAYRFR